jgi:hypothetical protein
MKQMGPSIHGHNSMVVGFTTTYVNGAYHNFVSSNLAHGEVYSMQLYTTNVMIAG